MQHLVARKLGITYNRHTMNLDLATLTKIGKENMKRYLLNEIECAKEDLKEADRIEKRAKFIIDTKSASENHWFWEEVARILFIEPLRVGREQYIKQCVFKLSKLNNKKLKNKGGITDQDIMNAREVPITNFIDVNPNGWCKCPFHNETKSSFKYYPKQNSFYCYSCNKGGSVIDFIMQSQNIDFKSAVKFLLK